MKDSKNSCFFLWCCFTVILLVIALACRPADQELLVAHIEGDVFLPNIRHSIWNFGDSMDCQVASRTSVAPDQRGDLLLCGAKTQLAWSQSWLRPDIRTQIYGAATKQTVKFHSAGHGGGRGHPISWLCKKTRDEIECN